MVVGAGATIRPHDVFRHATRLSLNACDLIGIFRSMTRNQVQAAEIDWLHHRVAELEAENERLEAENERLRPKLADESEAVRKKDFDEQRRRGVIMALTHQRNRNPPEPADPAAPPLTATAVDSVNMMREYLTRSRGQ
jgi:hypothetical protein